MKKWSSTIAISFAVILTACSKEKDIIAESTRTISTASKTNTTVSNWESGFSWSQMDSSGYKVYFHDRASAELTSDILNGGAVLVWAKNVKADDGSLITKPMKLPFHVLPEFGRPAYDNYWYYTTTTGNLKIEFRSSKFRFSTDPVPAPDASVQSRYFFIPQSDLNKWGYDANSITHLTYEQLTDIVGIEP